MAMKWVKGRTKIAWYPAATSQAFAVNTLVNFNLSGEIIPADSTSGDHIGIILKAITSASPEYATETNVPVEVPVDKMCELEADATGLTSESVGLTYDLTDAATVNGSASSIDAVTCVKYISATKGRFVLNSTFDIFGVRTT